MADNVRRAKTTNTLNQSVSAKKQRTSLSSLTTTTGAQKRISLVKQCYPTETTPRNLQTVHRGEIDKYWGPIKSNLTYKVNTFTSSSIDRYFST